MSTRAVLTPFSAEFPTLNFPALTIVNNRPALAFDATTSENSFWTTVAPQGLTGNMTAVLSYIMASANTGNVAFDIAVEAITAGDALDLDTSTSFANVNTGSGNVPTNAGNMQQISITLTNNDSVATADYLRFSVARNTALDTATGDAYLLTFELRDAA